MKKINTPIQLFKVHMNPNAKVEVGKILDSGYENAIIFEDDADILDNDNFKNIHQFLIPGYDFIQIGFCHEKYKDKVKQLKDYSIYKIDYALCTHAYGLGQMRTETDFDGWIKENI